MDKNWLSVIIIIALTVLNPEVEAQNPSFRNSNTNFDYFDGRNTVFLDIDKDGDKDLLLNGDYFTPHTVLYRNEGNGIFSEMPDSFPDLRNASIGIADIDNDNDLDILFTGVDYFLNKVTELHLNDGSGNYSLSTTTPFKGGEDGDIEIFDADNDGDKDVLILGSYHYIAPKTEEANLYINNGAGQFTEVTHPINFLLNADILLADFDNDNDKDVFIVSKHDLEYPTATYHENFGNGFFSGSVITGDMFSHISSRQPLLIDINGDANMDVFIYGKNSSSNYVSEILLNDGQAGFSYATVNPFDTLNILHAKVHDFNNDSFDDIAIVIKGMYNKYLYVYVNDGNGNFSTLIKSNLGRMDISTVAFSDLDEDSDADLLITGLLSGHPETRLFLNEGNQKYIMQSGSMFTGVDNSSTTHADIDNDGDNDVLVSGIGGTVLYKNDPPGTFMPVDSLPFDAYANGSSAFLDYDNDGDEDIVLTGNVNNAYAKTGLFNNEGNGNFKEIFYHGLPAAINSNIAIADVDKNGFDDLFISGDLSPGGAKVSEICFNNGNGTFSIKDSNTIVYARGGYSKFIDYDKDNDFDLFFTGESQSHSYIFAIYENDGAGLFTENTNTGITDPGDAAPFDIFDFTNDGYPDILLSEGTAFNGWAKIYRNSSLGYFVEEVYVSAPHDNVIHAVAFDDFNSDSLPEAVIIGKPEFTDDTYAVIYDSVGSSHQSIAQLPVREYIPYCRLTVFDADADGDKDLLLMGYNNIGLSELLINTYNEIGPVAVAKDLTIYLDSTGSAVVDPWDMNNGSTDNSGIANITLSKNVFSCSDLGTNNVMFFVEDKHGNIDSVAARIYVNDFIAPVVKTKNDTVWIAPGTSHAVSAAVIDNGSHDNCSINSMSLDKSTFTISDVGINVVSLTVKDSIGNTASAEAKVIVIPSATMINENSRKMKAEVFPVPSYETINVKVTSSPGREVLLEIIDNKGNRVWVQEIISENTDRSFKMVINASNISSGLYLMKITSGSAQLTKRIIVK